MNVCSLISSISACCPISSFDTLIGLYIFNYRPRHLFRNTLNCFSSVFVILHVSQPCWSAGTTLDFNCNIITSVYLLNSIILQTFVGLHNAACPFRIFAFMCSSAPPIFAPVQGHKLLCFFNILSLYLYLDATTHLPFHDHCLLCTDLKSSFLPTCFKSPASFLSIFIVCVCAHLQVSRIGDIIRLTPLLLVRARGSVLNSS